jgi:hypothetical protein
LRDWGDVKMCGIAVLITRAKIKHEVLNEIIQSLEHRAPINITALMQDEYVRYITCLDKLKQYRIFNPNSIERFLTAAQLKSNPNERDCMLFMGIVTTQILCEQFIEL